VGHTTEAHQSPYRTEGIMAKSSRSKSLRRIVGTPPRDVREYADFGRDIIDEYGANRTAYADRVVHRIAKDHGVSTSTVYGAIRVAKTFTAQEIRELSNLRGPSGRRLSVCHIRVLAGVKKPKQRWSLAREVVAQGLSVRQLRAKSHGQRASRKQGGRFHDLPQNKTMLLHRMELLCATWQQFEASFEADQNRRANAVRRSLPAEVTKAYETTQRAVARLNKRINGALRPAKDSR
jgi:hypothetical protein